LNLTKFKKIELNDEKKKLIQTVANILVPFIEKNRNEESFQIAETSASQFIFALIEAKRINFYQTNIEYIEEKMSQLEEERVEIDKNENIINTEIGGDRVDEMKKFNKKIKNLIMEASSLMNVFMPIIRDNKMIPVENKVKNQIELINSFANQFNRVVNEMKNYLNENEINGNRVVINKMMEELNKAERGKIKKFFFKIYLTK
ncbi:hypothetical protein Mgra_00007207, partial [Meloidogyne graminicola]